jgi:hypothetical protein
MKSWTEIPRNQICGFVYSTLDRINGIFQDLQDQTNSRKNPANPDPSCQSCPVLAPALPGWGLGILQNEFNPPPLDRSRKR